jgi:hypothetical protein
MIEIDLHGYTLTEAGAKLESSLRNALEHQEGIVRVIHGRGKHSATFPVIKSHVRHWLEESSFAREHIEAVFRGEDGSPYTPPNPGETIVVLRIHPAGPGSAIPVSADPDEEREARRNSKAIRADRLRTARRRSPRR